MAYSYLPPVGMHHAAHPHTLAQFEPPPPSETITMRNWQAQGMANASVRFDLEVAGDLATLQGTLLKHGWRAQTAADWVTALRLLDDSTPAAERPVLPVALSAHPERLLLRRTSSDPARIEVLRVWPAPVRLADGTPLWVARYERMQCTTIAPLSLWTFPTRRHMCCRKTCKPCLMPRRQCGCIRVDTQRGGLCARLHARKNCRGAPSNPPLDMNTTWSPLQYLRVQCGQ